MTPKIYHFHELGTIPGIPGIFHAGLRVTVDLDTMTVIDRQPIAHSNVARASTSQPASAKLTSASVKAADPQGD